MEFPSTKHRMIWARSAVLSWFMGAEVERGLAIGKRKRIRNFFVVSCAVISLALCVVGNAQSNGPTPGGGKEKQPSAKETKEANDRAGIMNRGTEAAPLVVRMSHTPVVKVSTEKNERETYSHTAHWGSRAEWATAVIALFALVVAVWQLCYFRTQLRMMGHTLKDAAKSVQIAERSAKATENSVVAMQDSDERQLRAYVSFRIKSIINFDSQNVPRFVLVFTNHGATPARDIEYKSVLEVVSIDGTELPPIIQGWNPKRLDLFPTSRNEPEMQSELKGERLLTEQELIGIRNKTHLICIGVALRYWDMFNREHTTGCYYTLDANPVDLVRLTTKSANESKLFFSIVPGTSKLT